MPIYSDKDKNSKLGLTDKAILLDGFLIALFILLCEKEIMNMMDSFFHDDFLELLLVRICKQRYYCKNANANLTFTPHFHKTRTENVTRKITRVA